jgi:hypothetical protein
MRKRKSTYEFKSNEDYEHHVAEDGGWPRERETLLAIKQVVYKQLKKQLASLYFMSTY